jgi:anti-anti-sigma factor
MPERFRDQINRALENLRPPEVTNVVVDFNQVSYFGSLMIASLVQIARRVQECGGKIALCNLTDESVDALRGLRSLSPWLSPVLGWPPPWQICENRQQALEAVSGRHDARRRW